MAAARLDGPPWRLLALLGVVLYVLLPMRVVYGRVVAAEDRTARVRANAASIDRRARTARTFDKARLRADLDAVAVAMPTGGIESWIDSLSGLARATGTTWRSGTVAPVAPGSGTAGEATGTTVTIVVDGPTPGLLAFVDQLRVGPPRLSLVEDFGITVDPKDARKASVSLKVRLLSFVPADPAPPSAV